MKILFIGEIVAEPGRKIVKRLLPDLLKENKVDLVLANAENISGGRGVTPENLEEMRQVGVDFFTSGDHVFWQKGTEDFIDSLPIVRPANYPEGTEGKGYEILDLGAKGNVVIVNLMGRTGFSSIYSYLDDPFKKIDQIIEETKSSNPTAIIVDFHAESSSEKYAFTHYVDGRVTAVLGSHTHVPTCDNMIFPKGTLFVSDVGMTGAVDSVLGVNKDIIIRMFQTARNQRFEWENAGRKAFRSVLLDLQEKSIVRIDKLIS